MIIKLEERISNMIAAGEVVTRPANALKEVIENALDAKATKINIDLLGNGLKQIKVIDNGQGMDELNLKRAFSRHATSKIKTEYDLGHILTLGFRGEAIPAIAAVSKLTIKSKPKNKVGSMVVYEGGKFISQEKAALNEGTEVIISELFYNVPARLKFIKNPETELSHLIEVCEEFMLSYPKVSFKLTHEGRTLRQSFGDGDYETLFEHIFGTSTSKNMLKIKEKIHDIEIEAYLGSPDITRARRNNIYLFLNGRTINNFVLTNAVVEGYHTRLMVNRYPIGVVKIKLDTSFVDVNVHPQKREVKISNEYVLASLIRTTIRNKFKTEKKEFTDSLESYKQISGFEYVIEDLSLEYEKEAEKPFYEESEKLPYLEYIGQFAGTYLLLQNELGLYLIDQHAAAERIRYEYYYEKLGQKPQIKPLLFPLDFEFRPTQEAIINKHLEDFNEIGLKLEASGPQSFYLTEMPIWLADDDAYLFTENIIEALFKYGKIDLKDLRDNLSKSIACKGAIKANEPLSKEEINQLIFDLRKTKNPYYCPHGRPVILFFSHQKIERLFKRIV
ncbi:MAG: DNA mismatch repair endonuclease MutL [Acholeplasmataceae bacterium]|jgi:DNA mismatch repair protein MutL|nr:DNA mismatch repair endonuclease MutL [Acholeplasmataceae bacterium]